MKCLICEKNYHQCPSCDDDDYRSNGFCSENCKIEYFNKWVKGKLLRFIDAQSIDNLRLLKQLNEGEFYAFESNINELINTEIKRKG